MCCSVVALLGHPKRCFFLSFFCSARGSNLTELLRMTCRDAGMTISIQLLGPAPLRFWRAKKSNIRRDFGQLETLIANIKVSKIRIASDRVMQKSFVNFGPLKSNRCACWPTHDQHCACCV